MLILISKPYYCFCHLPTLRYPRHKDCPNLEEATNPEADDEQPMQNYYFPDYGRSSCGFGRDYPAWMGILGYEKHYLFRDGEDCCRKYFPGASDCPYENTVQTGYFWESYQPNLKNDDAMPIKFNHTYYPEIMGGTCINGTDYPHWMATDDEYERMYLFGTLEGCCEQWFTADLKDSCMKKVVQGFYAKTPCALNRPECNSHSDPYVIENKTEHLLTKWYVDLDLRQCHQDGKMPTWMLDESYSQFYLFHTKEQCCIAFGVAGAPC